MNILRTALLALVLAPAALVAATAKTPAPAFDSSIIAGLGARGYATAIRSAIELVES